MRITQASTRRPKSGSIGAWLALGICAVLLGTPSAGLAQTEAECIEPQTQSLMNDCAANDYALADAALNEAWASAKAFADAIGQGEPLLEAQRAWLTYRDAACAVHASPYAGGSLQPMIVSGCLARLTSERTQMLLEFNAY
jgi:uncharacterized protein YecT (DUF1311 family)